jgi:hypothetical protein
MAETPSTTYESGPGKYGKDTTSRVLKKYEAAKRIWEFHKPLWSDVYTLAMPGRRGFYEETQGQSRTSQIFDETAVVAAPEAASKVLGALAPTYQRWGSLKSGSDVPVKERERVDRQLEDINVGAFEDINNSDFYQEAHDAMQDCLVGTGVLEMMPGPATKPLLVQAFPLTDVVIDKGPFGGVDGVYYCKKVQAGMAPVEWPLAKWPAEFQRLMRQDPLKEVEFLVATYRDWSKPSVEVTKRCVIWKEKKEKVLEQRWEGMGSNPFIVFRWGKSSGEIWGRGPLLNALPSIKTLNLTVQLILENAELAITGMWQADSNSVVNPSNIQLIPGTIIPIAPNSNGLQPLTSPGNFDVANLILNDMRMNVRRALYADQFGSLDKTPISATEAALRQQDMADRIGASFGRLQRELVVAVIRRVIWIQRYQGRIEVPAINGRAVKIDPISPLARAQRNEDIMAIERMGAQLTQMYGPQALMIVTDPAETAKHIADLLGVPKQIVRDKAQMKAVMEQVQQAAAQMQQAA